MNQLNLLNTIVGKCKQITVLFYNPSILIDWWWRPLGCRQNRQEPKETSSQGLSGISSFMVAFLMLMECNFVKMQTLGRFYKRSAKRFFMMNAQNKALMYYSLLLSKPKVFGHICWFSKFSILLESRTGRKLTETLKHVLRQSFIPDSKSVQTLFFNNPTIQVPNGFWLGSFWILHHFWAFFFSNVTH